VIVVAFLAALAALLFAGPDAPRLRVAALIVTVALGASALGHARLVSLGKPLLKILWTKGMREPPALYERWNPFSRIQVTEQPRHSSGDPFGWGLSSECPKGFTLRHLLLQIDSTAGTYLTEFKGDPKTVEYLRYDVVNLAHWLRRGAQVLAVGVGGGRDLLSALVFDQKSVVGVELNSDIIETLNGRFGELTGHLDRHPQIRFVHDEARSWIARQTGTFDVIQISLIDTWAATAAGAFVLAENSLYTVEAFTSFLDHLTPGGIFTVSRWYFYSSPREMYRLCMLTAATLMKRGVARPRDHMVVVRHLVPAAGAIRPDGIGTLLVSNAPFSREDLARLKEVCDRLRFEIVLSRDTAIDPIFETIGAGRDLEAFAAAFPLNISAPTDDAPFFFNMLRLKDIFHRELHEQGIESFNLKAVWVLGVLLIVVLGLTLLCIVVPLALAADRTALSGTAPLFVYFAGIGLGFMMVEISQMQRLIVFLGHPIFALSVVLFALLVSSGLGSLATQRLLGGGSTGTGLALLVVLLAVLLVVGAATPWLTGQAAAATTAVRIAIAVALLSSIGFFMGMAFPLGLTWASSIAPTVTPWLWGINGATSVCASVLSVAISLTAGIGVTYWTGWACYGVAVTTFLLMRSRARRELRAPSGC
ncbi:MAG: hypothetical protein HY815_10030, partial [Candidatus Riflebacteria bacterium]|nr:hypothetical protein [Candidatus Riflebacteria bacterium]